MIKILGQRMGDDVLKKRTIFLQILLALVIVAAIYGFGAYNAISANTRQIKAMKIEDVDLTNVADGTYTGSYSLLPVSAEVKVTVQNHRIAKIDLIKHNNGKGAAAEVIPGKVVESQTLQVDTISGATFSSKVILKAIQNALIGAGGKATAG